MLATTALAHATLRGAQRHHLLPSKLMLGAVGVRLVAAGHSHPSTVLATEALERVLPNVREGWMAEQLGIRERRIAAPHETIADHGVVALRSALDRSGWSAGSVDMIICGASFLEDLMPPRASVIAEAVNPSAIAFDVNAACASFFYALAVAGTWLHSEGDVNRLAVCVAERPTVSADYRDSHSSAFFGDSAGALLVDLEPSDTGFVVEGFDLMNDSTGSEDVRVPRTGHFRHDNRSAFQHVMFMGEKTVRAALDQAGATIDDVRAFVGHQANRSVLGALGERLRVPWERQWHNFEWAGNQGGAGVLTAFSSGWSEHQATLTAGDRVVLSAVGSGFGAGAAVLRWVG